MGSLTLLALASPLLVLLALAIVVETRGSPLFRQERRGRHGRVFRIVKLRTMHSGAESVLAELAVLNDASWPLFKIKGTDRRTTRVGRLLRRSSLDELPQLWNVLRGEMSLVGPRPLAVYEADLLPDSAGRRADARPGMTGLWQVRGRHELDTSEMLLLDLEYVDSCSAGLDLAILARTVPAVLRARGAY